MATELRWFKKADYESYGNDGLKHVKGETVLQFRRSAVAIPPGATAGGPPEAFLPHWSEWQDVPLVFEVD